MSQDFEFVVAVLLAASRENIIDSSNNLSILPTHFILQKRSLQIHDNVNMHIML